MKHVVTSLFCGKKTQMKRSAKYHHKQISTKKRHNIRFNYFPKLIFASLFLILFFFSNALADNQSDLHLSIDKTKGSTDDVFILNIKLKKASDENYFSLDNMKIPGLENFQITGSSSTTNVQIINGAMAAVSERNISIKPEKEGKLTIGPVKIISNSGEEIKSESVTIEVEKSLTQKTKETLLEPLKEETINNDSKENITNKNSNNIATKDNEPNQKKPLSSEKIQNTNFTNWFFWGQIFVGFLLFVFGIIIGKKLQTEAPRPKGRGF